MNNTKAAIQVLQSAYDEFGATYDRERVEARGPSAIGIAGAPLAVAVQQALSLLQNAYSPRAKAAALALREQAEANIKQKAGL